MPKTSRKPTQVAPAPPPEAVSTPPAVRREIVTSRLVKMVPRRDLKKESVAERALAGIYRMIHGSALIPRPWAEWHTANGDEILGEAKTVKAGIYPSSFDEEGNVLTYEGDHVWLNDEDAARLIDQDLIEPIDATPSRCGKVWAPPKPDPQRIGY